MVDVEEVVEVVTMTELLLLVLLIIFEDEVLLMEDVASLPLGGKLDLKIKNSMEIWAAPLYSRKTK